MTQCECPAQRSFLNAGPLSEPNTVNHYGTTIWTLAASVLVTVFVGGAIWLGFNKFAVFGVAGAVFGLSAVIATRSRPGDQTGELRDLARTLGLAFEPGEAEGEPKFSPAVSVLGRWVSAANRLSGTLDGVSGTMIDLTTIQGTGDSETRRQWTAIRFEPGGLPAFVCVPRSLDTLAERVTLATIHFDARGEDELTRQTVADFRKFYVLGLRETAGVADEEAARRLFVAPRLEVLVEHPGWRIESARGSLVLAHPGIVPAADRASLWKQAARIRRALTAPVSRSVSPIPAAPGMDIGRQRSRRAGSQAGGVIGLVCGFFGSFIAFAALSASRLGPAGHGPANPSPAAFMPWFFVVVIGASITCVLVGSWLGRRVADLRYRPDHAGLSRRKVSKVWVAAGAFLGWMLGFVAGMGLMMLITPQRLPPWVAPVAFFSPPVIGLVLGGFAGGAYGLKRAAGA